MTPLELVEYYANLLIYQYAGLNRAYNTILSTVTPIIIPQQSIQTIIFSPLPTSGTFVLSYGGISTSTISWNDSISTIQTDLQTIPDLSSITVSGSIINGLTINFVGVSNIADLLIVENNSLISSGSSVEISILETDVTLPLAVQDAFNFGVSTGVQLDVIGKYAGVSRIITTVNGTITLDDADFTNLIKFAIVQNNAGSSLFNIETNMNIFFPGQFILIDHKNMTMTYILSGSLGSTNFFTSLIKLGLIPKPMGVGINIFIPPLSTDFFGFSTYAGLNPIVKPFNNYLVFNTNWLFLSYANAIPV